MVVYEIWLSTPMPDEQLVMLASRIKGGDDSCKSENVPFWQASVVKSYRSKGSAVPVATEARREKKKTENFMVTMELMFRKKIIISSSRLQRGRSVDCYE
jgi:hypothetical protein